MTTKPPPFVNTYRLQMSHQFTFEDLYQLLPYLYHLGVDAIYLSPCFQTEQAGDNFYKITSFDTFDPSLKPEYFNQITDFLKEHAMYCLLDMVPNHMAMSLENPWIRNLSEYKNYFDLYPEEGEISFPVETMKGVPYRRFFQVKEMVGLATQKPEVFTAIHQFLIQLVESGQVTGVRIDHPDGLRHPGDYLERLSKTCPHVWCEKILQFDEPIPDWQTNGMVGYASLNWINHLLVDKNKRKAVESLYRSFTGDDTSVKNILFESKQVICKRYLHEEVSRFSQRIATLWESNVENIVKELISMLSNMPRYRTYIQEDKPISQNDLKTLEKALEACSKQFTQQFLVSLENNTFIKQVVEPLQQIMPGIYAKGYEDTFLYRYFPLSSLNEVGSDWRYFGFSVTEFEDLIIKRAAKTPFAMNTHSTHDTKRSLEVRMRIHALLDHLDEFEILLHEASQLIYQMPAKMIYLLMQTLVGVLPYENQQLNKKEMADRLKKYMQKAYREGKEYSDWLKPDEKEELLLFESIDKIMLLPEDHQFWQTLKRILKPTQEKGFCYSMIALGIGAFIPGVMDIYRGEEVSHLRLVDPDNRVPVDFEYIKSLINHHESTDLENWDLVKLTFVRKLLKLRQKYPQVFLEGEFHLKEAGDKVGCMRQFDKKTISFWFHKDVSNYNTEINWLLNQAIRVDGKTI